jgi:peptidoglycan hydrolase-like protein with peptidoglycan-binding domain
MQKLRAQLHAKEQELKQSEKEIEDMEWQLEKERQMRRGREKQLAATKTESGKKSVEVSTKNIQKALRQAGFYNGAIDGELGPRTKEAIKRFQKANGLKADGIVGKKTWQKLSQHL